MVENKFIQKLKRNFIVQILFTPVPEENKNVLSDLILLMKIIA